MNAIRTSMMTSVAAEKIDARMLGEDVPFSNVSTDSRCINRGDLFVALKGDRFDGHDYLESVEQKGAVAALVEKAVDSAMTCLVVDDTRLGLGRLAKAWREQVNPKVIALTGSNGKTTLKEMLSAIFSTRHKVLATLGNLNNDIGVPLTLLRLQNETLAVVEMGANHIGEIDYLSKIAEPDIAILNNAGTAHIGEFGSEENIAHGKAEIVNGLKAGGIFIYHGDSKWVDLWRKLASDVERLVSFGEATQNDYQFDAASYHMGWSENGFYAEFDVLEKASGHKESIRLLLAGRHNALNATAAISAARQMDIDWDLICEALKTLQPVNGRLNCLPGKQGQVLIDDTYNANADSVAAAIDVLVSAPGRKILVLGDLAELGEQSTAIHSGLGKLASEKSVDVLLTCGSLSEAAQKSFTADGEHFSSHEALLAYLDGQTSKGDFILVKGSRSASMDKVVDALAVSGPVSSQVSSGDVAC
ncbi:MAG: UDP-N-acetylmuramoyl-tripeptide--D-alanyl-D-alanine ligase [Gammaproteobacteria bacterium]|jgi:UDP-N-acetylmuramoyl-tripeptide--D-alanyl-D-alanine ligase